jgi:hypothetical protein
MLFERQGADARATDCRSSDRGVGENGWEDAIAKWQTFIAYLDQAVRIADSGRIDAPPLQNCN